MSEQRIIYMVTKSLKYDKNFTITRNNQ